MTSKTKTTPVVGNLLIGHATHLEITEQKFDDIAQARAMVDAAMDVEELWDSVVRNYRAYELAQAELSLQHLTNQNMDDAEFDESRRALTTHVANFLSSARSFLDIAPQKARDMGGEALMAEFKKLTSEAYDGSKSYRFMEGLRNYAQHKGQPITGLTLGISRSDKNKLNSEGDDWKLVHTTEARIKKETITDGFKAKNQELLEDLANNKGEILLTPHLREYVQGLNKVVLDFRAATKDRVEAAIELHRATGEELTLAGGNPMAQAVMKLDENGVNTQHVYLLWKSKDRLENIQRRNGSIQHLDVTPVSHPAITRVLW